VDDNIVNNCTLLVLLAHVVITYFFLFSPCSFVDPPTDVAVTIGRIFISLLVAFSYPLQTHPSRICLDNLYRVSAFSLILILRGFAFSPSLCLCLLTFSA